MFGLDLLSVGVGFVPGAIGAGFYAFKHQSTLTAAAADVAAIKAGVSTLSSAAAQAVAAVKKV